MIYKEFYTELGKLLYAVAKADGKVGVKEFDAMKLIVKQELVPLENSRDQFGTDNAFYTEMEFEYLEENFGDANSAFDSFINFIDLHHSAITPDLKILIESISKKLAASEFGINKKEKSLLDKLDAKLSALR